MTAKELDEEFQKSLMKCRIIYLQEVLKKNPKSGVMAEEYERFKKLLRLKCGLTNEGGKT